MKLFGGELLRCKYSGKAYDFPRAGGGDGSFCIWVICISYTRAVYLYFFG